MEGHQAFAIADTWNRPSLRRARRSTDPRLNWWDSVEKRHWITNSREDGWGYLGVMRTGHSSWIVGLTLGLGGGIALAVALGAGSSPAARPASVHSQGGQSVGGQGQGNAQQLPAPKPASGPIAPAGADDATALAKLNQLAGYWVVTGTATGPDGSAQGSFQGESQFGWVLGGNFLLGDHGLWNQQGAVLLTMDQMGFTPGVGFTRTEVTNGDRSMFISSGMYDAAADTIAFLTTNSLLTTNGQPRSLATSFAFQPDGTVICNTEFEVNDQPTGKVTLLMTRAPLPTHTAPQGGPGGTGVASGHGGQGGQGGQPMNTAQMKSSISSMMKQRQQLQSQMNDMHQQVQDMSRMMQTGSPE